MISLLLWGVLVWFIFMALAIMNATAREKLYGPHMPELGAHQLSSLIFSTTIFATTYLFLRIGSFDVSGNSYFILGIMWLGLTVAFEFIAGHFLFGNSWEKLLADYNLLKGRIWSLVLLSILFAPLIVHTVAGV